MFLEDEPDLHLTIALSIVQDPGQQDCGAGRAYQDSTAIQQPGISPGKASISLRGLSCPWVNAEKSSMDHCLKDPAW